MLCEKSGRAHYLGYVGIKDTNQRMAHRIPVNAGPGLTPRSGTYAVLRNNKGDGMDGALIERGSMNREDGKPLETNSPYHLTLSVIHVLVTVTAIAISITALIFAVGALCNNDECKTMAYLTNTFATTNSVGSQTGWAVATERAELGDSIQYPTDRDEFVFSHYYECMSSARLADKLCPRTEPLQDYISCLHNNTGAALQVCNSLSSSVFQPWPTAEDYLECLFGFKEMHNSVSLRASRNVFRTCLGKTMWPFFEVQQGIDSDLFLGSFNWLLMLAVGMWVLTSFAVYSVSPFESGPVSHGETSYFNRLGWLWACVSIAWNLLMVCLIAMLVFRDTTMFKDPDSSVPMTNSTALLCIFVVMSALFYFGSEFSEERTTVVGAHVFRTLVDRGGGKKEVVKHGHMTRVPRKEEEETSQPKHHHHHHHAQEMPDAETMPKAFLGSVLYNSGAEVFDVTEEDVAAYYTPPLLRVWADGLTLADPFIFLGVAGATGHLTTSMAWSFFFGILLYRLMGSSIARYLYQCFMNNLSLSAEVNMSYHSIVPNTRRYLHEVHRVAMHHYERAKQRVLGDEAGKPHRHSAHSGVDESKYSTTPHLSIEVMALSTQFSAILMLVVIAFVVFGGESALSEFPLFTSFIAVCFLVPEGFRILGHVVLQVSHPDPNSVPWRMLNFFFFVWIWDLLTRIIFVSIVIVGSGSIPGTRHFLMDNSIAMMDTYFKAFRVF